MNGKDQERLESFIQEQIKGLKLQKKKERSDKELSSQRARWFNREIQRLEKQLKQIGDEK